MESEYLKQYLNSALFAAYRESLDMARRLSESPAMQSALRNLQTLQQSQSITRAFDASFASARLVSVKGISDSFRQELRRMVEDSHNAVAGFSQMARQLEGERSTIIRSALAAESKYLVLYRDSLAEILRAQALWARTSQFSSTSSDFARLVADATRLFRDVKGTIDSYDLPVSGEVEEDPRVDEEIESIGSAFADSDNPMAVLRSLRALFPRIAAMGPKAGAIVLSLLLSVLANFIYDAIRVDSASKEGASPIVKEVRREARKPRGSSVIPLDAHVVVARVLTVRSGPGKKYLGVGFLYAGDMVLVIQTRSRSWSLVQFEDQNGEVLIRGWVFSRYVCRLHGSGKGSAFMGSAEAAEVLADDSLVERLLEGHFHAQVRQGRFVRNV